MWNAFHFEHFKATFRKENSSFAPVVTLCDREQKVDSINIFSNQDTFEVFTRIGEEF